MAYMGIAASCRIDCATNSLSIMVATACRNALEAHGALAGVESQVEHAVVEIGHDLQIRRLADAVQEALLKAQRVEEEVDIARGQGEDRRILVAIDAEDLGLEVRADLVLENRVAGGFTVGDLGVAEPLVGLHVRAVRNSLTTAPIWK